MIRLLSMVSLALLPLFAWPQASPGEPVKVMLVLDGSGSMWGQVENKAKIEIAREVLGDLLSLWDSNYEVGLTVYGHRRKGDCSDIETLVAVGGSTDQIRQAAGKINPKGKTPISASVTRAAEALSYTEEAATVILISDGAETCDADPCAVGKALEEKGVDFTTHVVGFDVSESEQAGLRCLAESTGGLFLAAENAASLSDALTRTVEITQTPAPPPPAEVGPIQFRALYAAEGPQIERGLSWDVFEAATNIEGKRKKVSFSYDKEPVFKLEPGDYLLRLKVGAATVEKPFSVDAQSGGQQDVVLDAGLLKMQGLRTEGADPIQKGTSWDVFGLEKTIDGKTIKITFSYDKQPLFTLPAGRYRVALKVGAATGETEVEVRAGQRSEDQVILNSGIAAVSAVLKQGQEPINKVSWDVFAAEKDIHGKARKVTFSYEDKPQWELTAGEYRVRAKRGNAQTELAVTVTAGQRSEAQVVLDAGLLKASASGGTGTHSWDVFEAAESIDGKHRKVSFSYDAQPTWTLPQGDYLVTVKRGEKKAQGTASVTAGQASQVTLTLE